MAPTTNNDITTDNIYSYEQAKSRGGTYRILGTKDSYIHSPDNKITITPC